MLTGGGNKPFPRDCPQDCQIGPFYAHGRFNETPLRQVNVTESSLWPDGAAMLNAPAPVAESFHRRNPPSVNECDEVNPDVTHGAWVGAGLYQVNLCVPPTQYFYNPWMVSKVNIPDGGLGSGYVPGDVGKVLTVAGGTRYKNAYAYIKINSVKSGKVTGASVVQHGSYLTPPTNPNPTLGGTVGTASFPLTIVHETVDLKVCEKTGHKNVAAVRQWHGMKGFLTERADCSDVVCADINQNYKSKRLVPDRVKYLTQQIEITADLNTLFERYGHCSVHDWSATGHTSDIGYMRLSQTMDVNPLSGERTLTGYSADSHDTVTVYDEETHPPDPPVPSPSNRVDEYATYNPFGAGDISNLFSTVSAPCGNFFGFFTGARAGHAFIGSRDDIISQLNADWNADLNALYCSDTEIYFEFTTRPQTGSETSGYSFSCDSGCGFGADCYPGAVEPTGYQHYSGGLHVTVRVTLSNPNPDSAVKTDVYALLGHIPLNDDKLYPFRQDSLCQVAPLMSRNEREVNVEPGTVGLGVVDDLRSPISDAGGHAPFSPSWTQTYAKCWWFDPACYGWQFAAGTDTSNAAALALVKLYDGSILGDLKPAGYEDFFCWQFADVHGCCWTHASGTLHVFDFYDYGYGMKVSDYNSQTGAQLPLNCTQWTDNHVVVDKPPGASLMFAGQLTVIPNAGGCVSPSTNNVAPRADALWAYKYATIKENWSAQNYYRGGLEKFDYLENDPAGVQAQIVYAAANFPTGDSPPKTSGPGSTWQLTKLDGNAPAATDIDTSKIWGGRCVGGFWSGCSYDYLTGLMTLGGLAFNVPTTWKSKSGDDAVCFGSLRYPTFPSLRGRVAAKMTGLIFTFDSEQPAFGMGTTGPELVDIFDKDMGFIAEAVPAFWIDNKHFRITVNHPNAAWVMINGSYPWYMNTNWPRGNAVALQWLWDARTDTEAARQTACGGGPTTIVSNNGYKIGGWSQTQGCEPFINCSPRVLCFSPNGEVWQNGVTFPFPTDFALDETYGSRWQGIFQTTMTDLYWQRPHQPAGAVPDTSLTAWPGETVAATNIHWDMDDGSCKEDGFVEDGYGGGYMQMWYPLHPIVEAEIHLPAFGLDDPQTETPPPLPTGIVLGWLDPALHTGVDVASPPGIAATTGIPFNEDGTPGATPTEWAFRRALKAATAYDSTCRFKTDYQEWFVI